MKNKNIKKQLNKDFEKVAVPNIIDSIKQADLSEYNSLPTHALTTQKSKKHFPAPRRFIPVLASFLVIVLISFIVLPNLMLDTSVSAKVSLDINPSVELLLNKNDVVVGFNIINDDGAKITDQKRMKNKPIEKVLNSLISNCRQNGYLSSTASQDNILLISVNSPNQAERLNTMLNSVVTNSCKGNQISSKLEFISYDPSLKPQAEQNSITVAKLTLIKQAYRADNLSLSQQEFIDLTKGWSISQLYQHMENK